MSRRKVRIDAFPESVFRYLDYDAIVCTDVILASTSLVTAVSTGRRVFAAANADDARRISVKLAHPLLATSARVENLFETSDSPAALVKREDVSRPLVLHSSPGTELLSNAQRCQAVYVASLRNRMATAAHLAATARRIALVGAGSDNESRCEDQMVVAWIARRLMDEGFEAECGDTNDVVQRWSEAEPSIVAWGKSAEDLRKQGRVDDLHFVLNHVDDLDLVCRYKTDEVRSVSTQPEEQELPGVWAAGGPAHSNVLTPRVWSARPKTPSL
jgi:phosphosulfolactate phosphohydrolase-like enzyme